MKEHHGAGPGDKEFSPARNVLPETGNEKVQEERHDIHGRRFGNAPVLRPGRKRKVKTFRANESGKEYITGLYLENDFFGYLALITGNVRNESAMALEDSEVALLPKQEFQQQLASDTTLSFLFISFVMNSLNEAEQRLLKLAYNSARSRVVEALLFLFRKYKAREGDTIPLSRENISTLAGISPESVSRNLGELRNEGLIEILHGAVKLCNLYKLEHLRAC